MSKPFLVFVWAVLCAAAFFFAANVRFAEAAPSHCLFPNTVARAYKIIGNGPAACAMNVCRSVGAQAVKYVPCQSGPACAIGAFYIEIWKAEPGAWAGLSACPTWTNTATWQ